MIHQAGDSFASLLPVPATTETMLLPIFLGQASAEGGTSASPFASGQAAGMGGRGGLLGGNGYAQPSSGAAAALFPCLQVPASVPARLFRCFVRVLSGHSAVRALLPELQALLAPEPMDPLRAAPLCASLIGAWT